jgi:hypothetical protein
MPCRGAIDYKALLIRLRETSDIEMGIPLT